MLVIYLTPAMAAVDDNQKQRITASLTEPGLNGTTFSDTTKTIVNELVSGYLADGLEGQELIDALAEDLVTLFDTASDTGILSKTDLSKMLASAVVVALAPANVNYNTVLNQFIQAKSDDPDFDGIEENVGKGIIVGRSISDQIAGMGLSNEDVTLVDAQVTFPTGDTEGTTALLFNGSLYSGEDPATTVVANFEGDSVTAQEGTGDTAPDENINDPSPSANEG